MNKVTLIGRITKDLELKHIGEKNTANVKFNLAVDNYENGQKGADFIPVTVWGKQAENLCRYCTKGAQIGVQGRIQTRNYDDKDGNKRFVSEVVVDNAEFTGDSKKETTETSNSDNSVLNEVPQNYKTEYSNEGIHLNDDDLPF